MRRPADQRDAPPPSAQGGALRSQDLRSRADPTGLDGTVPGSVPRTGRRLPYNPIGSDPEPNAARMLATGFRNPFRFTISRDR